jgi:hypothetical protein
MAMGGSVTKRRLRLWVLLTVLFFALVLAFGLWLRIGLDSDSGYQIFKDLMPLLVAIPAAWLGYCFQRRLSYLTALRELWKELIPAIQAAIQYTHLEKPSQSDFARVQEKLCGTIDALRGVFANIPRKDAVGFYPYEPLKDILQALNWLGFGDNVTPHNRYWTRRCIKTQWGTMHQALLLEFDTDQTPFPISKYLDKEPSLADLLVDGKLDESAIEAEEQRQRDRLRRWRG